MSKTNRIIIIGAGFAGKEIAAEILSKGILGKVVAFLDDDPKKIGGSEHNIPILGPVNMAKDIIKEMNAHEVLIAIPGAAESNLRRIYAVLQKTELKKIRILPNVSQIIEG
ncbi:MAG: polysaccharide biosynthesis protein, partial [Spirochaetales bacterium]|nr:polysaccharide biosynthesis protein [Spirochaetales bacterium]